MSKDDPFIQLLHDDRRYRLDAYRFVSEALAYAQSLMAPSAASHRDRPRSQTSPERHLTGQQLCDAIRQLAIEQFGLMAEFVSRWEGRLPEALASAAGTEIQIPPGNEDLIQIADQFDTQ